MSILPALFGIVITSIGLIMYRSPVERKMGLRNIGRRWSNTVMVVIGSLIGASMILGALTLSDSLSYSFDQITETEYGELDAYIDVKPAPDNPTPLPTINDAEYRVLKQSLLSQRQWDGIQPRIRVQVSPYTLTSDSGQDSKLKSKEYGLVLVGLTQEAQDNFGQTPIDIDIPDNPGEVIMSDLLADALQASEGDTIYVNNFDGERIPLTLKHIYPENPSVNKYKILTNPRTLTQYFGIPTGQYNNILLSVQGGVAPEHYDGKQVKKDIESAVKAVNIPTVTLSVREVKQEALDGFGISSLSIIFIAMSILASITGALLIVNLLNMLAEERKYELGVLRAIGMKRWGITKLFIVESTFYSIVSSTLGSLLGLGVGYLLVNILLNLFTGLVESSGNADIFDMQFHVARTSVVIAFIGAFLINILTSTAVSFNIARLDIVNAIRGLKDMAKKRRTWKWYLLTILLLTLSFIGLASVFGIDSVRHHMEMARTNTDTFASLSDGEFREKLDTTSAYMMYIGITLFVFTFGLLLARIFKTLRKAPLGVRHTTMQTVIMTATASALLVISIFMDKLPYVGKALLLSGSKVLLITSSLIMVIFTAMLITYGIGVIGQVMTFLLPFRRLRPILLTAFRYPSANRTRTFITLIMFGLTVFMLTMISIEKNMVNDELGQMRNSTVIGASELMIVPDFSENERIDSLADDITSIDGVRQIQKFMSMPAKLADFKYKDLTPTKQIEMKNKPLASVNADDLYQTSLSVITDDYAMQQLPKLYEKEDDTKSDTDVYAELLNSPGTVLLGTDFRNKGFSPDGFIPPQIHSGDELSVLLPDGQIHKLKVIGLLSDEQASFAGGDPFATGLVISQATLNQIYPGPYVIPGTSYQLLIDYADGVDNDSVTQAIKQKSLDYNIQVLQDVSQILGQVTSMMDGLYKLIQGFLVFALLIGTSGLAILMLRSTNERRQQIGMLRSLGYQSSMILASFILESSLLALLGILIGGSMGIFSMQSFTRAANDSEQTLVMTIPWLALFRLLVLLYVISIFFSILPARQASKMSPVEATNYPE